MSELLNAFAGFAQVTAEQSEYRNFVLALYNCDASSIQNASIIITLGVTAALQTEIGKDQSPINMTQVSPTSRYESARRRFYIGHFMIMSMTYCLVNPRLSVLMTSACVIYL
jgi:hypothetical protein